MDLSLLTLVVAAAPALVGAVLPRKWAYGWFGWYALVLGLLLLDYRPDSSTDPGGWLWPMAIAGGVAVVVRRSVDHFRPEARAPDYSPHAILLGRWELPVGSLAAALVFHGLCLAMAGFRPSWLAHGMLLVAIGIGFAVLLMKFTKARSAPGSIMLLAFMFLLITMSLVGSSITFAFLLSGRAARFADGAPYCIMTYDRAGRGRAATSTFDLSRLVMRVDGRHAARTEPWLVVQTRWGPVAHRWRFGSIFEVEGGPVACTPA